MIEHLEIKNFALIENLSIDFSEGFNVITGETGSGKSIILGALGFLMGERADSSSIRTGADEMIVNAVISIPDDHEIIPYLEERGIYTEDGQIIIKRTVKRNGKSFVNIQGQLVTRSELTVIADSLIDMHGQSEHQSLLSSDKQRKILDSFDQDRDITGQVSDLYKEVSALEKKKEELISSIEEGEKQKEWLSFALDEINSADIKEGEDELLKEKISVLGQFETIFDSTTKCSESLNQTKSLFYDASSSISRAEKCDSSLDELKNRIESARIETEDIVQNLNEYLSRIDFSEDAVNGMQERLALIQKLKRKYGSTIKQVLEFAEDSQSKLDLCSNSEVSLDKCNKELNKAKEDYRCKCIGLSEIRKKNASILEKQIESVLKTLGMPNAMFSINVETDPEKVSPSGFDSISFLICANPGEPLRQIKDIASGGELSRVMLALKTVLAKADSIQTQVFDEVDSGIGGAVALSLGECISGLSKEKQVIVITHLASIAAKAESHFVVSKAVEDGRTFSHLVTVKGNDRVEEIARMLSGDSGEITLVHARKLLGYN